MEMIENKYKKWYFSLMENTKTRLMENPQPYTVEKHHIIPMSLGGKNTKENLTRLTIREHLLAHRLLPKFLIGVEKAKMCHAYFRMVHGRQGTVVKISPSALKEITLNYSEARRMMRTGTKHTEETKRKISLAHKGKANSEATRRKISLGNTGKLLGVKKPKEFGENLSRFWMGKKKTKEHSDKINKNPEKIKKTAEKHRGMKRSQEAKEKMRLAALARIKRQGGPWNKGKKASEESREKSRQAWVVRRAKSKSLPQKDINLS
jgi:hypothetical protein